MIEEVKRCASPIPTGADLRGIQARREEKISVLGFFIYFLVIFNRGTQYLKH
jgi:hypothetical protein